jgi:SAM-dependent methyltransferase
LAAADPHTTSPWSRPDTVAGFAASPPNETLLRFANNEFSSGARHRLVDIGCGAGRNAIELARQGWSVVGVDLSTPMLMAAADRARQDRVTGRFRPLRGRMDRLPVRDGCADLIVAHGIWNLAQSAAEFRAAVEEAARIASPGAGLFVVTFSRSTLSAEAVPVEGEPFVFTQFSGQPQCFLTEAQLVAELAEARFASDPGVSLRELNRPRPGLLRSTSVPVVYEGAFRYLGGAHPTSNPAGSSNV